MKTKFKKMATICITMASLITSTCGGFGNLTNVSAADIINTGDYVLESALDPNMVADVENAGTTNECNLWLYERNNTSAQKFSIESAGNGYYTIKMAVTDDMVLDIYGGTGYQGCNVQIYQSKDTSNDNQLWSFEDAGDGYVYIKSKTGYYLDVSGGFTDNQTNIHVWTGNGTDAQRWKLVRCNEPDILKVTASQNVTTAFSDVKAGMWYVDAIQYVYDKGYMTGKVRPTQSTKGYFDISGTITKAEFATVLYNIAGKPPIDYYGFFSDVPDGQWFTKPALFSYYYGIVEFDDSLNNSIYDLNEKLTREKVAMMLYGYVKAFKDQKGYDTSKITGASNGYIDSNSISSNAKEAMDWAVTQHIIKGKGNANDTKDKLLLDPTASITRAECAQVIKNFSVPESITNNIVERANYLYNLKWTSKKNVNGWRSKPNYMFYTNQTYPIPYGQPVHAGRYIYYGISIDEFIKATQDPNSDFYNKRSICYEYDRNGNIKSSAKNSVFYAMDCSAFASYCWALPSRYTTVSWPSIPNISDLGKVNNYNITKIEAGDVLNLSGSHIVVVTAVNQNDKTFEITEMTDPYMKRKILNESSLISTYGKYTIYRNNNRDTVPTITN